MLKAIKSGSILEQALIGVMYVLATSAGSSVMMWILLKKEKGKRKVGG